MTPDELKKQADSVIRIGKIGLLPATVLSPTAQKLYGAMITNFIQRVTDALDALDASIMQIYADRRLSNEGRLDAVAAAKQVVLAGLGKLLDGNPGIEKDCQDAERAIPAGPPTIKRGGFDSLANEIPNQLDDAREIRHNLFSLGGRGQVKERLMGVAKNAKDVGDDLILSSAYFDPAKSLVSDQDQSDITAAWLSSRHRDKLDRLAAAKEAQQHWDYNSGLVKTAISQAERNRPRP